MAEGSYAMFMGNSDLCNAPARQLEDDEHILTQVTQVCLQAWEHIQDAARPLYLLVLLNNVLLNPILISCLDSQMLLKKLFLMLEQQIWLSKLWQLKMLTLSFRLP